MNRLPVPCRQARLRGHAQAHPNEVERWMGDAVASAAMHANGVAPGVAARRPAVDQCGTASRATNRSCTNASPRPLAGQCLGCRRPPEAGASRPEAEPRRPVAARPLPAEPCRHPPLPPYAPHPLRWLSGACRRAPRPRPRPPASTPLPREMTPNVTKCHPLEGLPRATAPRPMPSRSGSSAPLRSIPASFRSFPAFERIGTMAGDARGRRRDGCVECGADLPKEHSWPSQTARA